MGIVDKAKDALGVGRKDETTTGTTTGTTTATHGGAGYGVIGDRPDLQTGTAGTRYEGTGQPMGQYETGTAGATTYQTTTTTATGMGEGATCGAQNFTKVEDRPRVIEQKEYIKEHRPVEKEFVVETKFVGEREMQEGRTTEHLGTEERIVADAQPRAPCE